MKKIRSMWEMLGEPIYVGDRKKSNLQVLVAVSIVTMVLSLILIVLNIFTHQPLMLVASVITFVAGAACWFFAGVMKDRDLAAVVPLIFCAVAFTIYAVTGAGDGTAMLWSLLLPIGISYFVSVRYGVMLSVYYSILYFVLFYTPLKEKMSAYYSDAFMLRFPLVFAVLSIFTIIAMVQYHRGVLLENEYTERLNSEVEKQTRVATERAERLEEINNEMVQTLAVTIDAKDRYTNGHSFRVSWYAVALAGRLRWTGEELEELEREGLLHDIGKIGVPDSILNKPGKLSDEEFSVIKSHTTIGGAILSRSANLSRAAEVAHYHHERYDGKGYPEGLAGEDIPVNARIVAIADAYDAMRSDRIYRKGLPLDVIRDELVKGRGKQFDPQFLDCFLELADSGVLDEIAQREPPSQQAEEMIENA